MIDSSPLFTELAFMSQLVKENKGIMLKATLESSIKAMNPPTPQFPMEHHG